MSILPPDGLCRACHKRPGTKSRGLCRRCYNNYKIRRRYRVMRPFATRGYGLDDDAKPLPSMPTDALPGTAEKVTVMRARARAGVGLWHPGDATC